MILLTLQHETALLNYSLEKTVFTGHLLLQLLKEKGLIGESLALYTALTFAESQFLRNFVLPFQVVLPKLHDMCKQQLISAKQQSQNGRKTLSLEIRLNAIGLWLTSGRIFISDIKQVTICGLLVLACWMLLFTKRVKLNLCSLI